MHFGGDRGFFEKSPRVIGRGRGSALGIFFMSLKGVSYTEKTKAYYHQWIKEKPSSRNIPRRGCFELLQLYNSSVDTLSRFAPLRSVPLAFYLVGIMLSLLLELRRGTGRHWLKYHIYALLVVLVLHLIEVVSAGG